MININNHAIIGMYKEWVKTGCGNEYASYGPPGDTARFGFELSLLNEETIQRLEKMFPEKKPA